ncbi:MAG: Nif3-like dinuclear metal center hexameric protein [Bacilli bacterium]
MIKMRTLLLKLAKRFPQSIAKKYRDYVGHMTGSLPETVKKIILVLDLDESILDEVLAHRPDLVLTHHPLIYGTRAKTLKKDPARAELVCKLEAADICVYSYHTNFDEGEGGMNDALSKVLELEEITPLENDPLARGGKLKKPVPIEEFAKFALEKFGVSYGLLIAEGNPIISSVAIVGGGGSRGWRVAQEEGYDLFISGDAPHHVRRDVVLNKYNYLDLPHEIERIFMPTMKEILLDIEPRLEVICIDHEELPHLVTD